MTLDQHNWCHDIVFCTHWTFPVKPVIYSIKDVSFLHDNNNVSAADVYFELNGKVYTNNSVINIFSIGEDDSALLCKTDKQDCCGTVPDRFGEFYYPNGTKVPIRKAQDRFYRNRGDQLIRLNRRPGSTSPTGLYRCEIPDSSSVTRKIVANLITAEEWTHSLTISHNVSMAAGLYRELSIDWLGRIIIYYCWLTW